MPGLKWEPGQQVRNDPLQYKVNVSGGPKIPYPSQGGHAIQACHEASEAAAQKRAAKGHVLPPMEGTRYYNAFGGEGKIVSNAEKDGRDILEVLLEDKERALGVRNARKTGSV